VHLCQGEQNAGRNRDPACGWSVSSTKTVDLRRHLPDRVAFAHQDIARGGVARRSIESRRTIPLQADFKTAGSTGSFRRRLPVAAKIALVTAGAIVAVPGSPIPPGASVLDTR
jgi:hypothetical protein